MVSRLFLRLLGLVALLLSPLASSREGDYMGNGGGLGEQNAIFVWTQYQQMTSMLILESSEPSVALRAVSAAHGKFLKGSMEIRPLSELGPVELASSRHFGGVVALTESPQFKFIWVREKLQDSGGSALSLSSAAYWLTRAAAMQANLDVETSEVVSQDIARAFATELHVRALTRYHRIAVRLLTLKAQVAYLESSQHTQTLPLPRGLCESEGLNSLPNGVLQLGQSSWMNDENWDASTSTLCLGARSELRISCENDSHETVILEGEVTWEIPFTLRDALGKKVPYARARALVTNADYALVPSKVSWFGVRGLRRRE